VAVRDPRSAHRHAVRIARSLRHQAALSLPRVDGVLLASEIKAIARAGSIATRSTQQVLADYLIDGRLDERANVLPRHRAGSGRAQLRDRRRRRLSPVALLERGVDRRAWQRSTGRGISPASSTTRSGCTCAATFPSPVHLSGGLDSSSILLPSARSAPPGRRRRAQGLLFSIAIRREPLRRRHDRADGRNNGTHAPDRKPHFASGTPARAYWAGAEDEPVQLAHGGDPCFPADGA
jgi:hypothetical protein